MLEIINIVLNLFDLGQPNHSIFGILSGGLTSIVIVIYILVDRMYVRLFGPETGMLLEVNLSWDRSISHRQPGNCHEL